MSEARIAYLLKKFPRLSETFVLGEILGQEELGRSLHVFARRAADDEPRHPELARLRSRVETLPPPAEIDPWATLFGEADGSPAWDRLRPLVREASTWNLPRLPSLLVEALHLFRRTRELGIRHVHAHFATDSATIAMLLRRLGGPSYSVTAHAKDIYRSTVEQRQLERLFAESAFVVTVCDANVRHLAGAIGPRGLAKVRRLYNGIDLEAFHWSAGERDKNHVLAVGRLIEKKGFDLLIDAAALLRRRGVELCVTIVGDGEERRRLEARVAGHGLDEHVRLIGALDQDGVRGLMRRATLMVLPCRVGDDGNRDALPTVLLEALASGLCCVSTPVTGIPEILDHSRAGRLVPSGDVCALAEAMQRLLGDPEERATLARAGRWHAVETFDRRAIARTLHSWFDEALEGAPVPCGSPS